MNKQDKIIDICEHNRQCGSTTWILKAAVNNPNCIIIGYNDEYCEELKLKYFDLLRKENFFKRLKWKIFGRKHPKFLSVNKKNIRGYRLPIIFDNSALYL